MAGVAAYHLFRHYHWEYPVDHPQFWEKTLKIAVVVLLITAPFQVLHGDAYARHVAETQPQKFAAMEAVWETESYVPEYIIAVPTNLEDLTNPRAKEIFGIGIPGGASWLVSGGDPNAEITGLNEFETEAPPVAIVFWSFRIMVGLGFWFVLLAFWAGYRWWRGQLLEDDLLQKSLMASSLLGILAVEVGWIVTEVGRQPWVIQGVMKTADGVSPGLTGFEATLTLVSFAAVYLGLLALYSYVVFRIVRAGPPSITPDEPEADVIREETGAGPTPAGGDDD
jgi:cytochrome d ubiquinol oxidase subunit I